jgi:hypothetical protein
VADGALLAQVSAKTKELLNPPSLLIELEYSLQENTSFI